MEFQQSFKSLPGFNANNRVKVDHIFIEGEGCFFETEKIARENSNNKSGNFIDPVLIKKVLNGVEIYRVEYRNVWD